MLEKFFSLIENHPQFGFSLINVVLFIIFVVEVYKKEKFAGLKEHLTLLLEGIVVILGGVVGTLGLIYLTIEMHLHLNQDDDSL